jgi:hypothetical protein
MIFFEFTFALNNFDSNHKPYYSGNLSYNFIEDWFFYPLQAVNFICACLGNILHM